MAEELMIKDPDKIRMRPKLMENLSNQNHGAASDLKTNQAAVLAQNQRLS